MHGRSQFSKVLDSVIYAKITSCHNYESMARIFSKFKNELLSKTFSARCMFWSVLSHMLEDNCIQGLFEITVAIITEYSKENIHFRISFQQWCILVDLNFL